ncbi:hypothetical protein GCM10009665_14600 [Kitasatospora nipponensis]|uniref:Uncharacterized protein n=1 Tax=Kitasatospora nipponensis TaxID=258049 RepID=A0ABP4GHG2_9ACTN
MRGAPTRVLPVQVRQHEVGGTALVRRGQLDDARPHERMPEGELAGGRIDDQQAARDRLVDAAHAVPRGQGRALARPRRRTVDGARQQFRPDGVAEARETGGVDLLDPPGHRDAVRTEQVLRCAFAGSGGEVGGQLQQGQWVAAGLVQHQPAEPPAQLRVVAVQQAPGVRVRERADRRLRQPRGVEPRGDVAADRHEEFDSRAAGEPAADEPADVGAGVVQPLAVVDDEQQRPLLSRRAQQVEDDDAEVHDRRRPAGRPTEHGVERQAGGAGRPSVPELPAVREQRVEELVQTGVGQPGLRLDPGGAYHQVAVPGRELRRQVEQGALADARLSPEHQGLSVGGPHERGQPRPLAVPTDHHHARFHARLPPPARGAAITAPKMGDHSQLDG